jgi:two-component system LytT family response regulator
MIRVAIVDDEPHARSALRILLEKGGGAEVVAECRDGAEAIEVLRWLSVDVLLLDVQMPGVDGFGVLHALEPARLPQIIFITAFDEYALRAFEVGAVDYVLKPFDEARFRAAFDRARTRLDEKRGARWARRLLTATSDRAAAVAVMPRLAIPIGGRVVFIAFDDIDWIQAADQYVVVHARANEYLLRESLQRLAERLPADRFARIHRSHLVNVSKVRELVRLRRGDAQMTLVDGSQLRVSRRYRRALQATLGLR